MGQQNGVVSLGSPFRYHFGAGMLSTPIKSTPEAANELPGLKPSWSWRNKTVGRESEDEALTG